jgi:hypothetical protein
LLANIGTYIWGLFKLWINTIFVTPFTTADMLWLLVPIWLGWFFSEFFQEKTGTSIGNAISNAVIVIWGSIDCARQTTRLIAEGIILTTWEIVFRFGMVALVFFYGALIVWLGWKGNKLTRVIGRIREVTYVFVIFTPIFYNALPLSWDHIIAAVLFFPLFYFGIELLDRYTPNPKAIIEDMNAASPSRSSSSGISAQGALPRSQASPQQYQYRPAQPHPGQGNAYPQRPQQPQQPRYPSSPPVNPYNPYNRGPGPGAR